MNDPEQREEARQLRKAQRPKFLMGSPECKAFSQLLNFGTILEVKTVKNEVREPIEKNINF